MHTKHQIRQLLDSAGVRLDKRFGQHFLIDLNLMRLLIETADIQKNDVVLEVGARSEGDRVHYPEADMAAVKDNGRYRITRKNGTAY